MDLAITTDIVEHNECVFTVFITGHNVPVGVVPKLAVWALSVKLGIDMESIGGPDWDITEPEEADRGYMVGFSREV